MYILIRLTALWLERYGNRKGCFTRRFYIDIVTCWEVFI